jgi:hypothetical protein
VGTSAPNSLEGHTSRECLARVHRCGGGQGVQVSQELRIEPFHSHETISVLIRWSAQKLALLGNELALMGILNQ